MLRVAVCLIVVLAGIGALSGIALGMSDRSDVAFVVAVPGCGRVNAAYGLLGGEGALSVRAEACSPPGATGLLPENASFAALGMAVWRTPGRLVGSIALTLDRSAERPDGAQPRTLVLSAAEASARWGARPETPDSGPSTLRAVLRDVLLLSGFGAALLSFVVVGGLMVGVARRGSVVVLWLR